MPSNVAGGPVPFYIQSCVAISDRLRLTRPRSLAAVGALLLVASMIVGCGGSGERTGDERVAVQAAEGFLKSKLGTDTRSVSAVEASSIVAGETDWRVEVESDAGHRCIYMTSPEHSATRASFALISIKSGEACGDELLYSGSQPSNESALEGEAARKAYDAGYAACYGSSYLSPAEAGRLAESQAMRLKLEEGCGAANGDIKACVPPIYYEGDAYYCERPNGARYLHDPT